MTQAVRVAPEDQARAAADGWALADALTAAGGDVPAALARWERGQLARPVTFVGRDPSCR